MDVVTRALRDLGLLLQQDKDLPSVVGLIAGEPLRGSWWSHPKAQVIFARLEQLSDDPRVLTTRLISGKITFVDERLWPAFLGAALSASREGLSADARKLLTKVSRGGVTRASGDAARELQERLLVHAQQVHTESGRHETELQTWPRWSEGRGIEPLAAEAAREELERAAARLGAKPNVLPWRSRKRQQS